VRCRLFVDCVIIYMVRYLAEGHSPVSMVTYEFSVWDITNNSLQMSRAGKVMQDIFLIILQNNYFRAIYLVNGRLSCIRCT
jgi:hypothetical protein